ncbi:transcription initiation factor IIF, beta subunit-domain-containing protein [Powellomyces hirtus]|nr:transcription initiation factor IIF, beta subunit-domain-containing protein [Powellomyces hirtus]
MKDELADEDDELRLDSAHTQLWLVKVPNFLAEKWNEIAADDRELGTVEIPPLASGQDPNRHRATVKLPNQPWSVDLPKDYTLTFRPPQTGYAFTVNTASDRPKEIVGRIRHEGSIAPVVDDVYRRLMQTRAKTFDMKKRSIRKHDPRTDSSSYTFITPVNNVAKDRSFGLPKERLEKQDLINLIFSAFEKYAHWNFKGLMERTQQPQAWLKEVLNEVALLNKRGPYVGLYELKPEFKGSTGGDAGPTATSSTAQSTGVEVKDEDAEGGEDVEESGDEDFEEML